MTARAQTQKLSEGCASIIGENNVKAFLAFDADLRAALAKGDAGAVAMLIEYPLRVNEAPSSGYSINDPGALFRHFHEVFPPEVVRMVTGQHASELFCNDSGVMYGNGEVHVNVIKSGFGVGVIDLRWPFVSARDTPLAPVFVCRTDRQSVLVEQRPNRSVRYRSWNAGHSILDKPDLEIASGIGEVEGTGWCAHSEWTFKNANATYTVSELGCFPDSNEPPERARGQLSVAIEGQKEDTWWWCY